MQNQPLVTVYMPTYNRVELLKRAVESVRAQTYENLEIIIVDDCSQDNTDTYLKEIAALDSRISYYLKEKNSGACASRNIAINRAKGEFITGLDDDDKFLPERIYKFVEYSKKYDMEHTILFSGYSNGKISIKDNIRLFLEKRKIRQKDLLFRNFLGNQVFVKTRLLQLAGGFDEEFRMWQDLECWYRLLEKKHAVLIPDISYMVDINHEYTRITDSQKLTSTYKKFCIKHNLNDKEKSILTLHFPGYGIFNIKSSLYLKSFLNSKSLIDLYSLLRFLKKKFYL